MELLESSAGGAAEARPEASYLTRARLLVEEHAELFHRQEPRWVPRVVAAPPAAAAQRGRPAARRGGRRQLTLPLRPRAIV